MIRTGKAGVGSQGTGVRKSAEEVFHNVIVHPVSLAIAQLAGEIEGEQAAKGISIAIEHLIVGAIAFHLGFDASNVEREALQASS
jgi:predicted nucleic acid-binding protein